jgi:hypothetical protein
VYPVATNPLIYIYIYSLLCTFWSFFTSVCTNHLVLVVRWKGSHHLLWRTGHWSIFNHYFSRTSFLSIFYQKMIACNLVISVYPIYYSMEAGRHRRFQSTKAPYYAMIKVDIRMWSTIVFNKQLSFQLHFQKPWWVLMLTPICYNVHWIRHHYSFIHQPQTGHGYMTPNATTSQHGEFNQPGPSSLAPWYPIFHV